MFMNIAPAIYAAFLNKTLPAISKFMLYYLYISSLADLIGPLTDALLAVLRALLVP